MPKERVTMRKVREILRLVWSCSQSRTATAKSCGVSKTAVTDTVRRAMMAKLSWPLPCYLDDTALESLLYPPANRSPTFSRPQPDWNALNNELVTHKNLTLMLLWQEYKERDPEGYQYSQYCELFRQWRKKLDLSMRQEHRAGEKMFVDWAGDPIPIYDQRTDVITPASPFVAVLRTSTYTFARATLSQDLGN